MWGAPLPMMDRPMRRSSERMAGLGRGFSLAGEVWARAGELVARGVEALGVWPVVGVLRLASLI